MDWGMMKKLWLELVDKEFFTMTKDRFVEMRAYKGATQRHVFEIMDKTMLDSRLRNANPRKAYYKYMRKITTVLRKERNIENIQPVGSKKVTYTPAKENKKVSNEHCPLSPALAPSNTHRVDQNPETPLQIAEIQEDKDMGEYKDEDMEAGIIVSHEHVPSAPILALKIQNTETPLKEVCEGSSTVPPAEVKPGKVGKPVGAPTQDHS